jgi:hypothetical protein
MVELFIIFSMWTKSYLDRLSFASRSLEFGSELQSIAGKTLFGSPLEPLFIPPSIHFIRSYAFCSRASVAYISAFWSSFIHPPIEVGNIYRHMSSFCDYCSRICQKSRRLFLLGLQASWVGYG